MTTEDLAAMAFEPVLGYAHMQRLDADLADMERRAQMLRGAIAATNDRHQWELAELSRRIDRLERRV